jgi:DNA ligase-1
MSDLADGESVEMQGSGRTPYVLKNIGGVYSCTCPAWRNQSAPVDRRTCKHLIKLRGQQAESERIATSVPAPTAAPAAERAAPPVLLAHSWDNEQDLTHWWMSEKLDGLRAFWDGKQFQSRNGNTFHAPSWVTEQLPGIPLDGELWAGRKQFQKASGIVRSQNAGERWKLLQFVVFDAPAINLPFEQRLKEIQRLLPKDSSGFVLPLAHEPCRGIDHLRAELSRVTGLGGEGLILRQPESLYEAGRSTTLLKVKLFHDAEAVVIQHLPGAGRHKGRLGALLVELPNGKQFSVGTGFSDAERRDPPAIGSTVTFRYQELTDGGMPRFPSFVGVRLSA